MNQPAPALAQLATIFRHATLRDATDVFLERRVEHTFRFDGGALTGRTAMFHEGAAVRSRLWHRASDGLDRPALAALLGIAAGTLPPVELPEWPATPEPAPLAAALGGEGVARVIWRWSVVLVAEPRAVRLPDRPVLVELAPHGGRPRLAPLARLGHLEPGPPEEAGGGKVRPGPTRVVLGPGAAAVLLHELFGHQLEADVLLRGESPWAGRLAQEVTALPIDLVDDPWRRDLPGAFDVDDEGVTARPRTLLTAGRITGVLADRATATRVKASAGNGRRSGLQSPPRPRMSNLVATVRDGAEEAPLGEARVYVSDLVSGTVEPASRTVLLHVGRARALRRGVLDRPLAPFTLVGALDAVCCGLRAGGGRSVPADGPAWCGKDGDVVPVGAAAPWLLIDGLEAR